MHTSAREKPEAEPNNSVPFSYGVDEASVMQMAEAQAAIYQNNRPFPHIVLENFFDEKQLREVFEEIKNVDKDKHYKKFMGNLNEHKKITYFPHAVGPKTNLLVAYLNSGIFINYLEKMTGIPGLLPDPSYLGGGLHWIENGGFLEMHADFNHHPKYNLERRINLLLYLNDDWKEEYNGSLELWDIKTRKLEKSVMPIFNRCVIFSTAADSLHGHPKPLNHPQNEPRRSIALYYYTNSWDNANQWKDTDFHRTIFNLAALNPRAMKPSKIIKSVIHNLTPPIFSKTLKLIKDVVRGR